jgi:integrase
MDKLRGKNPSVNPRQNVGQWLLRWLEIIKPKIAPTTYERWETLQRLHLQPYIGSIRLAGLEPLHIEQLYSDLHKADVSDYTRRMAGVILNQALRKAVKLRLITVNPAAEVEKPTKPDPEIKVLDDKQVHRLLDAARGRPCYPLIAVAIGTGMRQGEILGLHWSDVDLDKGTLTVRQSLARIKTKFIFKEPKTKSGRRKITLPAFVVDALHDLRTRMLAKGHIDKTVFCTRSGKPISRHNLLIQWWRPLLKDAKLPAVRFHDLRHTHASTLISQGESIVAISKRLGHSKVTMTLSVYSHLMPNDDVILAERVQKSYGRA